MCLTWQKLVATSMNCFAIAKSPLWLQPTSAITTKSFTGTSIKSLSNLHPQSDLRPSCKKTHPNTGKVSRPCTHRGLPFCPEESVRSKPWRTLHRVYSKLLPGLNSLPECPTAHSMLPDIG